MTAKTPELPQGFAKLLRHYRERAGLSVNQLMIKLQLDGYEVVASTIYMWENGERRPSNSEIFLLLGKHLSLSVEEEQALLKHCSRELLIRFQLPYLQKRGYLEPIPALVSGPRGPGVG